MSLLGSSVNTATSRSYAKGGATGDSLRALQFIKQTRVLACLYG